MSEDRLFREALAAFQSGDLDRARVAAEKAVESRPDHGGAQHLLGLAYCRAGDLVRGLVHLEKAAKLDPSNPHFRVMLVRALVDSGRPAVALEWAQAPTGTAGAAILWHARAEAADAAGQPEIAAEAWSNCAVHDPSDWRAPSNAANALAKLGRWPEAAEALARAVELNPGELPLRRNYVSALGQSGQMAAAAREVVPLLAADPEDGAARLLYAKALSELGKHQESLDQYDEAVGRVLAREPADPGTALLELGRRAMAAADSGADAFDLDLLKAVAALLDRTNRIEAVRSMLDAARRAGIPDDAFVNSAAALALRDCDAEGARELLVAKSEIGDPVYHHRLLARIEELLGNPAAAFAASQAMNRSVEDYSDWLTKAAVYRGRVRAMRREAEQTLAAIRPLAPGVRRSPAFLVGFPRSGTTLLDTFLMGHPDTAVLEEVHMIGAAEARLGGTTRLDRRGPAELEAARGAYFAELDRHVDPAFDGLVIDKMPLNMLALPFIHAMFPDAKIIFARRHPCDCVLSCFMQSFVLNEAMANFLEIEDAADFYDAVLDQFTFTRANLPLAVRDLVYEQLVEDSEAALRPLIDFLGLEWDPALLDHQATASARGAIITPSYDQVIKPLDRAPSGRWLRYRDQLEPVLPVLLSWANALGYPLP